MTANKVNRTTAVMYTHIACQLNVHHYALSAHLVSVCFAKARRCSISSRPALASVTDFDFVFTSQDSCGRSDGVHCGVVVGVGRPCTISVMMGSGFAESSGVEGVCARPLIRLNVSTAAD